MPAIIAKQIFKSLTILADRFPEFVEKFTKLNNKLNGAFTYTIIEQKRNDGIIFPNPDNAGAYFRVCKKEDALAFDADTITLELFDVEIKGDCPNIPGYNLLGTIKDEPGVGVILHSIKEENPVPDDYRYLPISCDHCNTAHRRVFAFVIQNEEETLSIGRHCFGEFTGSNNNVLAAIDNTMLMESLFSSFAFDEYDGDREQYGSSFKKMYYVDAILAYAWNETQVTKGYVRRNPDDEQAYNTPDAVIGRVTSTNPKKELYTDDDLAQAKTLIEFIKAMPADNEYIRNMQAFVSADAIQFKRIGFVASAVSIWFRHLKSKMNLPTKVESNHIGIINEKITNLKITVLATKIVEGNYGNKQMVKMIDEQGNVLTWWNSSSNWYDVGFEAVIKSAKVKLHDVYNNQKQTTVSHVKFIE